MLQIYIPIVSVVLAAGLLVLWVDRGGISRFMDHHRWKILWGLILVLAVAALILSLTKRFNVDEFEHIHSAWYIQNGALPYRDFYQHHHPLLWPALVPVLGVFGHTVTSVLVLRLLNLAVMFIFGWVVFRIAVRAGGGRESGMAAAILLLSSAMFVHYGVEIRPDVVQGLLVLVSILCLLSYLERKRPVLLALSGLSASFAFLFLQKAVFFLIVLAPVLAYLWLRRRIPFKALVWFGFGFLSPLVLFTCFLFATGSWDDYILTNWLVNLRFAPGDTITPFKYWRRFVLKDLFLWGWGVLSLVFLIIDKKHTRRIILVTVFFVGSCAGLFVLKRPYGHNFLLPLSLLAVLAAESFVSFCDRRSLRPGQRLFLLLLFVALPLGFTLRETGNTNHWQLRKVAYVLAHSTADEKVYDGNSEFNLFRPDLHYFWYSLRETRGLGTYNRVTGNRFGDFDPCRLVREQAPRFTSDTMLDMESCGLNERYHPAPFPHLFQRGGPEAERP